MKIVKTLKVVVLLYVCYLFYKYVNNEWLYMVDFLLAIKIPFYSYTILSIIELIFKWKGE